MAVYTQQSSAYNQVGRHSGKTTKQDPISAVIKKNNSASLPLLSPFGAGLRKKKWLCRTHSDARSELKSCTLKKTVVGHNSDKKKRETKAKRAKCSSGKTPTSTFATSANNGYNPLRHRYNPKIHYFYIWLDSIPRNSAEFLRNGIIAEP
ncbi:hypothetical protein, partial [Flagellimonas oceanensis]|uniref:hypothetical protein n=1 Tax=Flagellimonas oceanensis TaxID=2499163 RepID=UPI00197BC71C